MSFLERPGLSYEEPDEGAEFVKAYDFIGAVLGEGDDSASSSSGSSSSANSSQNLLPEDDENMTLFLSPPCRNYSEENAPDCSKIPYALPSYLSLAILFNFDNRLLRLSARDPTKQVQSDENKPLTEEEPAARRSISAFRLAMMGYFFTCGGPFGIEPAVSAAGPLYTLVTPPSAHVTPHSLPGTPLPCCSIAYVMCCSCPLSWCRGYGQFRRRYFPLSLRL